MKQIRKALIAAGSAFVTGVAAAWAQKGAFPGWPEIGAAVGLALAAGLATWRVPNGRAVPDAVKAVQAAKTAAQPPGGDMAG